MVNAIETDGLSVRFGEFTALSDVSIRIPEASFVAVLGPNGSGKTTLLRVLIGLLAPTEGIALLYGKPPLALPPSDFGYVPQLKTLDRSFPATSCELVVSGLRRSWPWLVSSSEHERAMEMLAVVGAGKLAHRPISVLSGGELQRVYLARAMIRNPLLLLLDEPASGVDEVGEAGMYQVLEDYIRERGATVLMITHDWGAAFHHSTLAVLLNRRLISFGAPKDALKDEFLREAFGHAGHGHPMGREVERDA